MKTILCYGDSNVFGYNPINGLRYSSKERWSGILKNSLLNSFDVIEQGQNNRTAIYDGGNGTEYCTRLHLKKVLEKIKNVDILILAVGINDLQFRFDFDLNYFEKEFLILLEMIISKKLIWY